MMRSLRAEWQKAKRRHDLLACLLLPLAVLLWAWYAAPDGSDSMASGYHALLYSVPIMNTVLLPIGMAMLASRLWDVEVKGNFPKLLYTLQSRQSLFAAKSLLGAGEIFLIVLLELLGIVCLALRNGYQDTPSAGQLLYLFLCTGTVSLMLFFSELMLTVLLANPLPALCTGIAGALIGLFAAFMPRFSAILSPGVTVFRWAVTASPPGIPTPELWSMTSAVSTFRCWYGVFFWVFSFSG